MTQVTYYRDYRTGAGYLAPGVAFKDVGTSLKVRANGAAGQPGEGPGDADAQLVRGRPLRRHRGRRGVDEADRAERPSRGHGRQRHDAERGDAPDPRLRGEPGRERGAHDTDRDGPRVARRPGVSRRAPRGPPAPVRRRGSRIRRHAARDPLSPWRRWVSRSCCSCRGWPWGVLVPSIIPRAVKGKGG